MIGCDRLIESFWEQFSPRETYTFPATVKSSLEWIAKEQAYFSNTFLPSPSKKPKRAADSERVPSKRRTRSSGNSNRTDREAHERGIVVDRPKASRSVTLSLLEPRSTSRFSVSPSPRAAENMERSASPSPGPGPLLRRGASRPARRVVPDESDEDVAPEVVQFNISPDRRSASLGVETTELASSSRARSIPDGHGRLSPSAATPGPSRGTMSSGPSARSSSELRIVPPSAPTKAVGAPGVTSQRGAAVGPTSLRALGMTPVEVDEDDKRMEHAARTSACTMPPPDSPAPVNGSDPGGQHREPLVRVSVENTADGAGPRSESSTAAGVDGPSRPALPAVAPRGATGTGTEATSNGPAPNSTSMAPPSPIDLDTLGNTARSLSFGKAASS
ncbi:hypothetical protein AURDEDRAFT_131903, partial [Auricularia subglabra TFB-10046 SS5]